MGIKDLDVLKPGDRLELLAQKVRTMLKTELDYHQWKTSGALRSLKVCTVIEQNPEYHNISENDIGQVIHRVSELVAKY